MADVKQEWSPASSAHAPGVTEEAFKSLVGSKLKVRSGRSTPPKGRFSGAFIGFLAGLNISERIKRVILFNFGYDGYDPVTGKAVYSDGEAEFPEYVSSSGLPSNINFPIWTLVLSILGLPSRPGLYNNSSLPRSEGGSWKLVELFKNFIGGWDFAKKTSAEKKVWQVVGFIPVKLVLIPLVKLLMFPIRLAINLAKLAILVAFGAIAVAAVVVLFIAAKLLDAGRDTYSIRKHGLKQVGSIVLMVLGVVVVAAATIVGIFYLAVPAYYLGLALVILSPAVYARKFGQWVNRLIYDAQYSPRTAKVMGWIGTLSIVLLTAYSFAIVFPVLLSAMSTLAPVVAGVAKLPLFAPSIALVSGWVAALAQLPWVAAALTAMNAAITSIAASSFVTAVGAYFALKVAGLATVLGLPIPAAATLGAVNRVR